MRRAELQDAPPPVPPHVVCDPETRGAELPDAPPCCRPCGAEGEAFGCPSLIAGPVALRRRGRSLHPPRQPSPRPPRAARGGGGGAAAGPALQRQRPSGRPSSWSGLSPNPERASLSSRSLSSPIPLRARHAVRGPRLSRGLRARAGLGTAGPCARCPDDAARGARPPGAGPGPGPGPVARGAGGGPRARLRALRAPLPLRPCARRRLPRQLLGPRAADARSRAAHPRGRHGVVSSGPSGTRERPRGGRAWARSLARYWKQDAGQDAPRARLRRGTAALLNKERLELRLARSRGAEKPRVWRQTSHPGALQTPAGAGRGGRAQLRGQTVANWRGIGMRPGAAGYPGRWGWLSGAVGKTFRRCLDKDLMDVQELA